MLNQLDLNQWTVPAPNRKVLPGKELDSIYLWTQNDKGKQKEIKVGQLYPESQTA